MTTAASASLAHDTIVIGCDFALAVIVEPIAGQSAAEVVTAMGAGASATASIVDFDAASRTITISMTDAVSFDALQGTFAWRVILTTSTAHGAAKWPVRMPRRVTVSRRP
jgi:hypothetical protein